MSRLQELLEEALKATLEESKEIPNYVESGGDKQCQERGKIINFSGKSYLCDPPNGFAKARINLLTLISSHPFRTLESS